MLIHASKASAETVDLYFMDFDVETYVPMTKAKIEEQSNCLIEIEATSESARPLADFIWATKIEGSGEFDNRIVRLKVSGLTDERLSNGDYFVDRDGNVSEEPSGSETAFGPKEFEEFKEFIRGLASKSSLDCT